MRVNPNNIYGPSTAGTQSTGRTEGRGASRGADALDSASLDSADISTNASLLSRVLSKASTARQERVAELHGLVQSGGYSVDPLTLGRSMVNDMLGNR